MCAPILTFLIALLPRLSAGGLDSWEPVTVSGLGQTLVGVATGDGWWAAVSSDGSVFRSQNGRDWQSWKVPHQTSTTRGVELTGVAVGDGRIVAVGFQTSANKCVIAGWPLNAATGTQTHYYAAPERLFAVTFARGKFTAVGEDHVVFDIAHDGTGTLLTETLQDKSLRGITFGGHPGRYVAIEVAANVVWVSDDRAQWTSTAIPGGQVSWEDVAYVGDRFLAVGLRGQAKNGVIAWSLDGLKWERLDPTGSTYLYSVGGGAGQFFVTRASSNGIAELRRGTEIQNLKHVSLPDITPVTDIAYNGFQFLAVGAGGAGWLSGEIHGFDYTRFRPHDEPALLDFVAALGQRHRLERSSNLKDWELLLDVVGQGNLVEFKHPPRDLEHEFYRMNINP
ncbi:MAG: hypothetical protein H7A46_03905 [Verrucomicrobiales bacterium]|nr:hypothetical protein [Verrucomicrobiales bacterium]